jgi:hypothetical protein
MHEPATSSGGNTQESDMTTLSDDHHYHFPGDDNQQPPAAQPAAPVDNGSGNGSDDGSPDGGSPQTGADSGTPGIIGLGSDSNGLDISAGDTDGDGNGLVSVQSGATSGVAGGALERIQVDAITPDAILDAHAPSLIDATVDGDLGDGLLGGSITDGLSNGNGNGGIQIDALEDGNVLDVTAPQLADATVGGAELGNLIGGLPDTGTPLLGGDGITVDALTPTDVADVHSGAADATVSNGDLGGLDLGNALEGLLDIGS